MSENTGLKPPPDNNSFRDKKWMESVSTKVLANEVRIATNTTDIATNTTDIATNTADIATNATDIATLEDITDALSFTTSEVDTGTTHTNGDTIYKKTVSFGSMPNTTTKSVAHGITGLNIILSFEIRGSNGSIYRMFPDYRTDCYIKDSDGKMYMTTTADFSAYDAAWTLWYLKT